MNDHPVVPRRCAISVSISSQGLPKILVFRQIKKSGITTVNRG
jgi:hypothetical protein